MLFVVVDGDDRRRMQLEILNNSSANFAVIHFTYNEINDISECNSVLIRARVH